jgi:lipid A 3-O-deacylase
VPGIRLASHFFCGIIATPEKEIIVSKFRPVIAALALLSASPAALAIDGVSLEYGNSDSTNSSVNLYRVGVQWDWNKKLFEAGNWHLGGYWDLNLGYWDNRSPARTNSSLADIGFTPVFRFQQNSITGLSPYAELAVGVHFLSRTSVSTQREFGSSFQFGDHIGAGVRFGDKGQYDIGYRYQHLSNAGIKEPNQGINFNQVRFQYHF